MRRGVVLDASVLVARLIPQDEFHDSVKTWLYKQDQLDRYLVSPLFALAEVAGAITRRTGRPDLAHLAIHSLASMSILTFVSIEDRLLEMAANLAAELGLRGADAIYVAMAAYLSLPLCTLDEDQRLRSASRIDIEKIQ